MTALSELFQEDINALNGRAPLLLIELRHPALADVVRLAWDTINWGSTAGGTTKHLYIGTGLDVSWPDQQAEQLPRATISIVNIGRELTQWVEETGGGDDAEITLILVSRRTPDRVERKVAMELKHLKLDIEYLSGELGFDNLMGRPACQLYYRPDTAPGVF